MLKQLQNTKKIHIVYRTVFDKNVFGVIPHNRYFKVFFYWNVNFEFGFSWRKMY